MKTKIFIYSIYSKDKTKGKTTLKVYRIKHNIPYYLGFVELNESYTRGYEPETFDFLINNGYLPSDFRGSGYYCDKVEAKGIKIIGV